MTLYCKFKNIIIEALLSFHNCLAYSGRDVVKVMHFKIFLCMPHEPGTIMVCIIQCYEVNFYILNELCANSMITR